MKLVIISDLHLDKKQYRTNNNELNRFESINYDVFDKNIEVINKSKADLAIICGDIFDKSEVSVVAMNRFRNGVDRLNKKTLAILGNHDFSQKNYNHKCSNVETILGQRDNFILADYSLKYQLIDDYLFLMVPFVYTNREYIQEMFEQCEELLNSLTYKKSILVTHGVTEDYARRFEEYNNEFVIVPNSLLNKLDYCLIGHIHKSEEYKVGKCLVISPGALMNWDQYKLTTGPVILDLDTGKYSRKLVDSIFTEKYECDESNINEVLSKVGQNITKIKYKGDINAIDNILYLEAISKSINLSLEVENEKEVKRESVREISNLLSFEDWIATNHLDKFEQFKEAINSIS